MNIIPIIIFITDIYVNILELLQNNIKPKSDIKNINDIIIFLIDIINKLKVIVIRQKTLLLDLFNETNYELYNKPIKKSEELISDLKINVSVKNNIVKFFNVLVEYCFRFCQ